MKSNNSIDKKEFLLEVYVQKTGGYNYKKNMKLNIQKANHQPIQLEIYN